MAMGRTTKIILGVLIAGPTLFAFCLGAGLYSLRVEPKPDAGVAVIAGDAKLVGEWSWEMQGSATLTHPDGGQEPRRAGGQSRRLVIEPDGTFTDVSKLELAAPCVIRSTTSLKGRWQASSGIVDFQVEAGEVETSDSCEPKPTPTRSVSPAVYRSTYELGGGADGRVMALTDPKGVTMVLKAK